MLPCMRTGSVNSMRMLPANKRPTIIVFVLVFVLIILIIVFVVVVVVIRRRWRLLTRLLLRLLLGWRRHAPACR